MILYSYWRSTTSYRVRAVLNLLGLDYEIRPVNLLTKEHRDPAYAALNPAMGVPSLTLDDGTTLTQSMAIIDYLLASNPGHQLMPDDALQAARVRAAVDTIAMDIHPVNNLRVIGKLADMGHSPPEVQDWMRDWMQRGFSAYQSLIPATGRFSFGDRPGLADICLAGQMINARRWSLDLSEFSRLAQIDVECNKLPAFIAAHPDNQPDADP